MSDPDMPRSSRSDSDMLIMGTIVVIALVLLACGGGFVVWRWRAVEQIRREAIAEEMVARDEAERARLQAEEAQARAEAIGRRKQDARVADLLHQAGPKAAPRDLEQAIKLCGQGQVDEGILWFVQGLEQAGDDAALQRTFRINIAAWGFTPPDPATVFDAKQPVTALAFSPDGKTVLAGAEDGSTYAWPIAGGKPGQATPGNGRVTAVGFGAGGKEWLVARGGQVQRSDAATGQPVGDPVEAPGAVLAMTLKADVQVMMLGTCNQGVWLAEDGRRQGVKNPFHAESPVLAAALGVDAKLIVTGQEDHTIQLHDVEGASLGSPLRHDGPVRAVALSADGRLLAAAAGGTVRLWDVITQAPVGRPLVRKTDVLRLAFSPDGRQLLLAERSGIVETWKVPSPQGGDVRRLRLWAQVLAGKELDAAGTARPLGKAAREERRQQLQELGGPPAP